MAGYNPAIFLFPLDLIQRIQAGWVSSQKRTGSYYTTSWSHKERQKILFRFCEKNKNLILAQ
jgi:hypothetical protein